MADALAVYDRLESNVRSYVRDFPTVFVRARGAFLYDAPGRQYLDFFSGAGALNYGHNPPALKEALIAYLAGDGVVHSLDMATEAKGRFLETFEAVVLEPRGYRYKVQFTGPTGTNAVEAALKIARKTTGRANVITFTNGFHGMSFGALAASGNARFRQVAGLPLSGTTFLPYDGYLGPDVETLGYLTRVLDDRSSGVDLPAAVIVETVQAEGGVNVARPEWLRGLQDVCRRFDMLLIVDDIQVGCGRTGPFFSFEGAGIRPDVVTLSKSLSGLGLPFSLVLLSPEVDQWRPAEHTGTFRGNNLAFVTAACALEQFWTTDELSRDIAAKAERTRLGLDAICQKYPEAQLSVRGRGLIQGLVSGSPGLARATSAAAFENGMIIETSGAESQVLKLLPPLTIEPADLDAGLDIIDKSVGQALSRTVASD